MDLLQKLQNLSGRPKSFYERTQLASERDEIKALEFDLDSQTQLLEYLSETEQALLIEYEATVKYHKSKLENLAEEVEALRARSKILHNYIAIMNTEEFLINKVKNENDEYCKLLWLKLKELTDRSRKIVEELKELRELHNKCQDLKHKANSLMAPSH